MKSLALLGSTGSIGTQTLEIVRESPDELRVAALGAHSSWRELLQQALEFEPAVVALTDAQAAEELRPELPEAIALLSGPEAIVQLVNEADYDLAVHGIVGAAGLAPSVEILRRKKPLALANKESLVIAGELLMELARENDVPILPVDSEHAAIFQCLKGEDPGRLRRIVLTASGGPFRDRPLEELAGVTPEEALRHPNWDMGPRITVGSATLMNKALEVIEAHHLFGVAPEQIEVVIHRQSLVHSMVEFVDGSVIAQLGPPDMRIPIRWALFHPDRCEGPQRGFDVDLFRHLDFEAIDPERFPTLELGYAAVRAGEDAGACLNASDEVLVEAFLAREIGFQDIARINRRVLERRPGMCDSVGALLEADRRARDMARSEVPDSRPGPIVASPRG